MRLIKKYKNRRLYDTQDSKYITFEDLKQLVLDEVDFKVMDTSLNKDITSSTLLQVIVENEAHLDKGLSTDALRYLIKMSSHPMHEMYHQLFDKSIALMSEQMKDNLHGDKYQQLGEQWMRSMETAMTQWQDIMKPK